MCQTRKTTKQENVIVKRLVLTFAAISTKTLSATVVSNVSFDATSQTEIRDLSCHSVLSFPDFAVRYFLCHSDLR